MKQSQISEEFFFVQLMKNKISIIKENPFQNRFMHFLCILRISISKSISDNFWQEYKISISYIAKQFSLDDCYVVEVGTNTM